MSTKRMSPNYAAIKKMQAAVLLLCFLVIMVGGLMGGVSSACGANAAREILRDLRRPNTVPEDDFYDE